MPDTYDPREKELKSGSAPRLPAADEVLRARPVTGKTDHRALTREIVSRFPKILAALAK